MLAVFFALKSILDKYKLRKTEYTKAKPDSSAEINIKNKMKLDSGGAHL